METNIIYKIEDDKLWDCDAAEFVAEAPEEAKTIPLVSASGDNSEKYLAQTLRFYGYPLGCLTTNAEKFVILRKMRDERIAATDYLMMPDYPISASKKAEVEVYRTALRDLPAQPGAPWDGGGKLTPWPEAPEI